jgi:hypothetical protein
MMNQPTQRTHRARDQLIKAGRDYPNAWGQVEGFRAARGQPGFDWPDWCFLPLAGAYAIVSGGGSNRVPVQKMSDVARLGALAAWRMTQGIYRFDPAVYGAVADTPVAGDLPCDVLMRMPEWCVYIETPGMESSLGVVHGFWAHLEYDANTTTKELRLLLDMDPAPVVLPLHLGSWSLAESIARAVDLAGVHLMSLGMPMAAGDVRREWRQWAEPLVSLLLYLCSTNDLAGKHGQPGNPVAKRTRRDGLRIFAVDGPRTWDVGVRMGAALRAAYMAAETAGGSPSGGSPRGHVRRAHWHGFRSGPRKRDDGQEIPADQRAFEVRWLPPIPVNLPDLNDLPATVRSLS